MSGYRDGCRMRKQPDGFYFECPPRPSPKPVKKAEVCIYPVDKDGHRDPGNRVCVKTTKSGKDVMLKLEALLRGKVAAEAMREKEHWSKLLNENIDNFAKK